MITFLDIPGARQSVATVSDIAADLRELLDLGATREEAIEIVASERGVAPSDIAKIIPLKGGAPC